MGGDVWCTPGIPFAAEASSVDCVVAPHQTRTRRRAEGERPRRERPGAPPGRRATMQEHMSSSPMNSPPHHDMLFADADRSPSVQNQHISGRRNSHARLQEEEVEALCATGSMHHPWWFCPELRPAVTIEAQGQAPHRPCLQRQSSTTPSAHQGCVFQATWKARGADHLFSEAAKPQEGWVAVNARLHQRDDEKILEDGAEAFKMAALHFHPQEAARNDTGMVLLQRLPSDWEGYVDVGWRLR